MHAFLGTFFNCALVCMQVAEMGAGGMYPLHFPGYESPGALIFSQLGFSSSIFYEHEVPLNKP